MQKLLKLSCTIDSTNRTMGRLFSWLALVMVLLMFFNVISRYVLNINLVWQQELVGFMHAILFLATAGYTLLDDKHVRVDVLYQQLNKRKKAIVELVGTIIFLFPVCIAIGYFSFEFISSSWEIKESSSEYNGMPGVFVLKSFIWVFCFTLTLQGISTICKSIITLREKR
ncbi:MAG: C4-dicarboxylate ABC transporter permease [Alphaproteobacteria bacterium CG11_big_fil_rev_8_21_14_0_20_39_49]|nr:MAG: C4-dicarboxylate ABC transporter permease [Alphaproteobacteria bacterium CG11_big_fil_rev_8_21_14_0_20_39_49]